MAGAPDKFWPTFGTTSEFAEVVCGDGGSLAAAVLSTYGIRCNSQIGGSLPNLDIKRMDAIQVIKLSLLEATANDGQIYEPIMSSEGVVEFVAVGAETGLSGGDIYYEIQTGSYKESCGGVMITGAMPLGQRKAVAWKPIWQGGPKQVFDTTLLVNEHCMTDAFSQQATIIFNDPHLDSQYEDGIDNLYNITKDNAYDHILGYARFIDWPGADTDKDAVIKKEDTAKILLPLPTGTLGTLAQRPDLDDMGYDNVGCYKDGGITVTDVESGVMIEIPQIFRYENIRGTKVDKLQSILDVYVVGIEIADMRGLPPSDPEACNMSPLKGSAICTIKVRKSFKECFKLERGKHYVVGYSGMDGGDKTPYIVFIDNSRTTDPIKIDGKGSTKFNISPESVWQNNGNSVGEALILPTGGTHGIMVSSVFVSVLLDTPSIVVYHPDGKNKKAKTIADELTYWVTPLVSVEMPRPIAFNGDILDMKSSILDHDPTTTQNLTDTPYELALDRMEGNGMALTLSFLNEGQCAKLSGALYSYLNSSNSGGTESTFVCGPDAEAFLGGSGPNGGIVNSITYSYQDSNSYTISVNTGPTILGDMSQVEGGPSPKKTEDISAVGTIIQDMGNHVNYKVRMDGFGERIAVNLSHHILRVGDKVSCTVHNNPVES
jgi:hypothetical protein